MLLNELLEAQPKKTAVVAWGRMNPPTIGHQKVLDVVNQHAQKFMGDPILFLTKTQKPKTDPLSFAEKLHFAQEMFNVPVDRNTSIKTIIQMFQHLQSKGYDNVILVAGSDRVQQYQDLIDKYNNKPDTKGEVPFTFANAKVISSGERDPDAEGVAGMSSSKVKKLAAEGKFEDWKDETDETQPGFKSSVPGNEALAKQMYNRVRQGMGIADTVEEGGMPASVIKSKQRYADMTNQELADRFKDSDEKTLRQMAWRHGYGNMSSHYFDRVQKGKSQTQEAAGVGIVTKQNTTKDVNKGTLKKMMKAYKLA
jgi:hypothetical protein|tara:strand:- start:9547 stop:10476 length:930 start_codon:yes stop_codon:yes gene_type:complete